MQYRPEIDGLRALAVLPVIFFHAGVDWLSGGYVGVDIFFVISGFLITTIIYSELSEKRFSILKFYERRARRILPALFLVLIVSTVVAIFTMLPYKLVTYGQALVGTVLFISNIVLWKQSGYFATEAEMNPLLHTWSLGVEEQYYLFFPLGLMLIWWMKRQWVITFLVIAGVASLLLSEWASSNMPNANFYLLPTRVWELLVGGLLSIVLIKGNQPGKKTAETISLAGLFSIAISIFLYDSQTPFPSFYALLPVLGSAAIIYAATPDTLTGKLLSTRPLVLIGLISYSAYLWHQPLFAFARIIEPGDEPGLSTMIALAFLSLMLAFLTWKYVEQPFRNKKKYNRNWVFGASFIGSVLFVLLGAGILGSKGLLGLYSEPERKIVGKTIVEYGNYVEAEYNKLTGKEISEDDRALIIVGDSFSQDFYNIVRESKVFSGYEISTHYVPARCQIFYGIPFSEVASNINESDREMCKKRILSKEDVENFKKADVIVFALRWEAWSASLMGQTMESMGLTTSDNVIIVGSKQFEKSRAKLLAHFREYGPDKKRLVDEKEIEINNILKEELDGYGFVDIISGYCAGGVRYSRKTAVQYHMMGVI
ncbi:acyltransferase family protein [Alcanivorax sp. IL1]|uniref:acyltransferase family protein n=1 Tax=Alcanivorax sp. IL1 TaxID=3396308 RepID=UPI0039C384D0